MTKPKQVFRRVALSILLLFFIVPLIFAQDADTTKKEKIKKGWNFGGLPVVSFDSDLGFQYGLLGSIYHYGDGSRYPEFDHNFYVEASRYTKGSGIFRFAYESDRLIKNARLYFDVSYLPDDSYDFFGFNGYEAVYNEPWINPDNVNYKTRAFYKMSNKMFRLRSDIHGKLGIKNLYWTAGAEFYNLKIGSVDIEKFNKGKDDEDLLPTVDSIPGLYENYQTWGLIPAEDKNGGQVFGVKAGLMYDSRNVRAHPTKGIWTEIGLFYAPNFANSVDHGYLKFYATHRQYLNIVKRRLTFAYGIGYQSSLVNQGPWYTQQFIITSALRGATSDGLGGGKTLRGIKRNRVVGDGVLYGNLELRWKVVYFQFIGQNFYIGLNGFADAGQVVKLIPTTAAQDYEFGAEINESDYFDYGAEKLHISYGAGLRIAMNENFIISCDYGRALKADDGTSGVYIGLNYLF